MAKRKKIIDVVLLLDRSGSMAGTEQDIIGGYNGYINGFKNKNAYKFVEVFYWDKTNVNNFFTYVRKSNFFLELEVIEGALEYINKLYDEGNEIYFITYRSGKDKRVYEMTRDWLSNKGFKYNKLFMDGSNKGMICKNNQVDLFIRICFFDTIAL